MVDLVLEYRQETFSAEFLVILGPFDNGTASGAPHARSRRHNGGVKIGEDGPSFRVSPSENDAIPSRMRSRYRVDTGEAFAESDLTKGQTEVKMSLIKNLEVRESMLVTGITWASATNPHYCGARP